MAEQARFADFQLHGKVDATANRTQWKAVRKHDGCTYTLTEIPAHELTAKDIDKAREEIRVLSQISSKNVLKYYDSFSEKDKLYLVTEYAAGGSLTDFIASKGPNGVPEAIVWRILLQLCLALRSTHSKRIVHGDMNPRNVFIDNSNAIRLGQFALSSLGEPLSTISGSALYMSPELCSGGTHNEKTDIWALGVVIYECCTGKHPFTASNMPDLAAQIRSGKPVRLSVDNYSEALRSILDKLLCVDSDSRPSASDILNSPSVQEHGRQLHISLEDDSKMNSNLKPSTQPASTGRSVKGTTEERLGVSKRTKSGSPSAAQSSPGKLKSRTSLSSSPCKVAISPTRPQPVRKPAPAKHASTIQKLPSSSEVSSRVLPNSEAEASLQHDATTATYQAKPSSSLKVPTTPEKRPSQLKQQQKATEGRGSTEPVDLELGQVPLELYVGGGILPVVSGVSVVNGGYHSDTDVEDAWSVEDFSGEAMHQENWIQEVAGDLDSLQLENKMLGNTLHNTTTAQSFGAKHATKMHVQAAQKLSRDLDKQAASHMKVKHSALGLKGRSTVVDEDTGLERACP